MTPFLADRTRRAGAALLLIAPILLAGAGGEARADVILDVSSNGVVGDERTAGEERQQTIYARPGRLLVVDRGARFASVIRTDGGGSVREFDIARRMYVQRPFAYYRQLREERVRQQAEAIRQANQLTGEEQAEARAALAAQGLRLNGQVAVRVERRPNETRDIAGYRAEHVRVWQNDLVVFDLWVTRELADLPSLLQIQREIGVFHEEVIRQAAAIEGFPLEMTACIDLGSLAVRQIHIRARALRAADELPDHFFDVPEGFQRVEDFPEPAVPCPVCGGPVDPQNAEVFIDHLTRRRVVTCSPECMAEYQENYERYSGNQPRASGPDRPR